MGGKRLAPSTRRLHSCTVDPYAATELVQVLGAVAQELKALRLAIKEEERVIAGCMKPSNSTILRMCFGFHPDPSPPAGAAVLSGPFGIEALLRAESGPVRMTQGFALAGIIFVLQLDFIQDLLAEGSTLIRGFELLRTGHGSSSFHSRISLVSLDYELRSYIVKDRSLRIRTGVDRVGEVTLRLSPISSKLLSSRGLFNSCWASRTSKSQPLAVAGVPRRGGGSHGSSDAMHVGYFRGVDNASQIRDLILDRLGNCAMRAWETPTTPARPRCFPVQPGVVAARALLEEVRLLRGALV